MKQSRKKEEKEIFNEETIRKRNNSFDSSGVSHSLPFLQGKYYSALFLCFSQGRSTNSLFIFSRNSSDRVDAEHAKMAHFDPTNKQKRNEDNAKRVKSETQCHLFSARTKMIYWSSVWSPKLQLASKIGQFNTVIIICRRRRITLRQMKKHSKT